VELDVDDLHEASCPKISFSIIQDGGGRHLGFCSNLSSLRTVRPIALKFGEGLQDDDPHVVG
jgi:hypothetical protein